MIVSVLLALLPLTARAETAFFESKDNPDFTGTSLFKAGILSRAFHTASRQGDNRRERQAVFAGIYASGFSLPEQSGQFLYQVDAALTARIVQQEESDSSLPQKDAERILLEPGRQLFAGITLCDSAMCGVTLGRGLPGALSEHLDALTGSHGPRTGATVFFHGQHVLLRLTPWFLPGATGGGLDGTFAGRSVDTDGQSGRGARLEAGAFFKYGGIGLHYESISRRQSTRTHLKGRELLNLAGIGFLLKKEDGFLKARFHAALEHASGRYAAATNDESGSPFAKIEGAAARTGMLFAAGPVQFSADLFLPEPGSPVSGRRRSTEISGYAAHGNAIGPTDLRSTHIRPFPGLCREACSGLDTRDREHAGLLHTALSYQGDSASLAAEFRVLRPLLSQEKSGSNPLRTTRRDPSRIEYHEASLLLGFQSSAGALHGRYSRMRGRKSGKSFLASESFELSFLRYL